MECNRCATVCVDLNFVRGLGRLGGGDKDGYFRLVAVIQAVFSCVKSAAGAVVNECLLIGSLIAAIDLLPGSRAVQLWLVFYVLGSLDGICMHLRVFRCPPWCLLALTRRAKTRVVTRELKLAHHLLITVRLSLHLKLISCRNPHEF